MATRAGAQLLGLGDDLGRVAPGCRADLVILRTDSAFLTPLNHPLHALVYAETASDVDTVLVDGRVVFEGGRVLGVDEDSLRRRAQTAADGLRARNRDAWALAARLAPHLGEACRAAVATPFAVNRYAAPVPDPA